MFQFENVSFGADSEIDSSAFISVTDGGRLTVGDSARLDRNCSVIARVGSISIGRRSYIGVGSIVAAKEAIVIGDDVLVGEYVTIRDQNHIYGVAGSVLESGFSTAAITIGDNVWLGAKATILAGVSVGRNSVVGAGAVVTRDVPPYRLAIGVPARCIEIDLNKARNKIHE